MDAINDKIEKHGQPDDNDTDIDETAVRADGKQSTGIKEVDGMYGKVDKLEKGEKRLQAELSAIQSELEKMSVKLKRNAVSSCCVCT